MKRPQRKKITIDPKNRVELDSMLDHRWKDFDAPEPDEATLTAWRSDFFERIVREGDQVRKRSINLWKWAGYAACFLFPILLFCIFTGKFQGQPDRVVYVEKYNPKGRRSVVTLPDGSTVHLGPDSRVKFSRSFSEKIRMVFLEGEAFFKVVHKNDRPFVVSSGSLKTQVLGTSFKIDAFKGQDISVAVATGKVSVTHFGTSDKELLAVLLPGQLVSYNPLNHTSEKKQFLREEITSWTDGQLVFTNTKLGEMAAKLSRWYNVQIGLDRKFIKDLRLSLTIDGRAPINSALEAICAAAQLKYTIRGNQIRISPEHY